MRFLIEKNGTLKQDEQKVLQYAQLNNIPYIFFSMKQMERNKIKVKINDLVFGGIKSVFKALKILNKPLPIADNYPIELKDYYFRNIWYDILESAIYDNNNSTKYFIKPRYDFKTFNGFCLNNIEAKKKLIKVNNKFGKDYEIACSEKVSFKSEYRLYILNGEIKHISNYWNHENNQNSKNLNINNDNLNIEKLNEIVQNLNINSKYLNTALDVGILDCGIIAIIENNGAFSIDSYDCSFKIYTELLINGWNNLTK